MIHPNEDQGSGCSTIAIFMFALGPYNFDTPNDSFDVTN